jgi:uncharacterized repeat protein (TIGR03803 family)
MAGIRGGCNRAGADGHGDRIAHLRQLPQRREPYGSPIRDSAGNLYGTTYQGGAYNSGTVFELEAAGIYKVLYSFQGGADGNGPYAGLVLDSAGNFYGTTFNGGASGKGVVYKLTASGQETVLYTFTGGSDGGNPYAGVARAST